MPLIAGTSIARFTIIEPLGSGGMGEIYRAHDPLLNRDIAIKILPAALTGDSERVQRFVREARAASALTHPNIVTVHDIGEAVLASSDASAQNAQPEHIHYIAMELIDGLTLRLAVLERRTLTATLDLFIQITEGVARAHESGIIHRDLKPDNVMVTWDGYAKILDFGLAKLVEPTVRKPGDDAATLTMTDHGRIIGTAGYMAPEQVEGGAVDARADIFSFGCMLYEAVTGDRAFAGTSTAETLHKIVHEDPPHIARLSPDAPVALTLLVRKCLEKNPGDRYQSIRDVGIDLRRIRRDIESGSPVVASPLRSKLPLRTMSLALLLFLVIAGAVSFEIARWRLRKPPVLRLPEPSIERLTFTGDVGQVTASRDGHYIAFTREQNSGESLWIRQMSTGAEARCNLPVYQSGYGPIGFSPDSSTLYFTGREARTSSFGDLYRVAVIGGEPLLLFKKIAGGFALTPDGRQVIFARRVSDSRSSTTTHHATPWSRDALIVADIESRAELRWREVMDYGGSVRLSPDGKRLAVALRGRIASFDFPNGRLVSVYHLKGVATFNWRRDATQLVVAEHWREPERFFRLWLVSVPGGAARKLTSDAMDYWSPSPAGDGVVALQMNSTASLWIVDVEAPFEVKQITRDATGRRDGGRIAWTEDGRVLFYSVQNDVEFCAIRADGNDRRMLYSEPAPRELPFTRPCDLGNGAVLFVSLNQLKLMRVESDGTVRRLTTTGPDVCEVEPMVSRAAQCVIFQATRRHFDRGMAFYDFLSLMRVPVAGGTAVPIISGRCFNARLSPDGTTVAAVCSDEAGTRRWLAVRRLDHPEWSREVLLPRAMDPGTLQYELTAHSDALLSWSWAPDGLQIRRHKLEHELARIATSAFTPARRAFVSPDQKKVAYVDRDALWVVPIEGGARVRLAAGMGDFPEVAWSPDSRHVAFTRMLWSRDVVVLRDPAPRW